ncbi:hypothetical protein FIV42_28770 [Persicimonas caeni]|uniref:Uncharacterized protein n=1 Tax=Persicimonas caeni TaxID=2292766 RepID=A0A4Y6Q3M6_PERCE|nr:hypothetical protein [Persicimonas caeni]QDG54595.1 hypothetical protein FIV42_28770 [Persicimonas caeni]QED35816.1 hypothetical protein FRD00_28765 [Persicimonas caeni]
MSEPTREEIKERTAKIVRRLGYVVFMGGGLLIFIPMLIGVGSGISNDRIWDPVTGRPVTRDQRTVDCKEEARRLLVQAGEQESLTGKWDEPYRAWLVRCQEDHPTLYDMLAETRQDLLEK